jgi:hypothetical protein
MEAMRRFSHAPFTFARVARCYPVGYFRRCAMSRLSTLLFVGATGLLAGVCGHAQDTHGQASVPPPPGINDPGVKPAPASSAPTASQKALKGMPDLPAMSGDGHASGRDGMNQPPPTVDVRTVGKDKVEEYRINGKLYMIHVIPKHGVPQTYMVNQQGELMRKAGQPPVSPVFYTIYKWGGPKEKKDSGN